MTLAFIQQLKEHDRDLEERLHRLLKAQHFRPPVECRMEIHRMHYPLVIVCESGKRLGNLAAELCGRHGWVLRQAREIDDCLSAMPKHGPAVLVLEFGRADGREYQWLARMVDERPSVRTVAVVTNDDLPASLCWDLGVSCVVERHRAASELPAVVAGLMRRDWPVSKARDHGVSIAAGP